MRSSKLVGPILALLTCTALPLAAQGTGTVRGQVTDSVTKQALVGVTVQIQGTPRTTTTGNDGSYSLGDVPEGSVVVRATRIGFGPQQQTVTVTAGGSVEVQFALAPQASLLEPVLVTGYGTTRREAVTGSVASVDAAAANVGVKTNVTQMIQGRAAGVEVSLNNGEPGAGAQIRIRGGSSVSARNDPLYVIDGVPISNVATEPDGNGWTGNPSLPRNPLNLLNPSDIASITILKDASATAIYGSRASNGVVLVETKRGQSGGGATFEYDGYVSTSTAARSLGVLTGAEYESFVRQQVAAGTLDSSKLGNLGIKVQTGPNPGDTTRVIYNTDWEKSVMRSPITYNQNLSFSGGTENTHYRGSVNYAKEQGVTLSSDLERIQGRLSATHSDIDGRLRLGLNVTSSRVNNTYLTYENQGGFEGGVFENVATFNPTTPVTVSDSTGTRYYEVGGTTIRNPVALANQIQNVGSTTRTLGNAEAEFDVTRNLVAKINVGLDNSNGTRDEYYPIANPLGRALGNGLAQQQDLENNTQTLQTLLTYDGRVGESNTLNVVGGYEYSKFKTNWVLGKGIGFFTDAYGFHALDAAVTKSTQSSASIARLASFFGRANVGFNERFFLTGVLRYDGSSRFAEGHKWALFPALSGSWNLKQQGFMPETFSEFKVRAGWGLQGNPSVDPYTSLITLRSGSDATYPWGDAPQSGAVGNSNGNPELKWEQTSQFDAAVDFGLWDNRLSGTIEYYTKSTQDLLLTVDVAQPALAPTQLRNVGKLAGHGWEFALNALAVSKPGLTWRAGLVFAADRNRVTDLGCGVDSSGATPVKTCPFYESGDVSGQGQSGVRAQRVMVCDPWDPGHCPGYALGTFYGPVSVGVTPNGQEEFFCTAATTGCVNGRTTIRGNPDAADYRVIGNANPDFTLGFTSNITWKRFDVSFLIHAAVGQDVFNNSALVYSTKSNALQGKNLMREALSDPIGINEPAIYSSRWIEDASFVRLQNITIGYDLNVPFLMKTARSARLYVAADNLFVITGYSGLDPEVYSGTGLAVRGVDYLVYPRPRTITGGLRLVF